MFGKKPATSIGPHSALSGDLTVGADDVQVEGRVDGSIVSDAEVIVVAGGSVHGDIEGDSVTIGGQVEGSVVARGRLHMLATGSLQGDARYGTLEVDRGGIIDGRTSATDPAALPPVSMDDDDSRETTMQFAPVVRAPSEPPDKSEPPAHTSEPPGASEPPPKSES